MELEKAIETVEILIVENKKEVVLTCIIAGVILLFAIIIEIEIAKVVREISPRYQEILQINKKYCFYGGITKDYGDEVTVKTRAQFNNFYYIGYLKKQMDRIDPDIQKVMDNRKMLCAYKEEIENMTLRTEKEAVKERRIPYFLYCAVEDKVIRKKTARPVTEMTYTCKVNYTSPRGRSSCSGERIFSFEELERQHKMYQERRVLEESKEYQRQKMTPSLRYDIMKRDGFRCVLCGRSVERDGVTLHVDHIIPVAKGGKTVPGNLRTLCEECNKGKRDKYDKDGLN